jgi:DNA helicase-2/ATP-dependent DNA helicase PcrA
MKGLEKDIVFLMGMCEGVFPDYRATSKRELDEERNNAFVAVTRSRRWLYITYPLHRKMPWGDTKTQRPSRFITAMQS